MLTQFVGTPVEQASGMTGFMDRDVRAWSGMEIKEPSCVFQEDGTQTIPEDGAFSQAFSGLRLAEASRADILKSTRMGHIELPVPMVNIEYVRGKDPVLPGVLGIPRKAVDDLLMARAAVATRDFTSQADGKSYHRGEVISFLVFSWDPDCGALGGAGVRFLLEEKGASLPGAVLSALPVLPVAFLLGGFETDAPGQMPRPIPGSLGMAYDRVTAGAGMLRKLMDIGAPDIIVWNEIRRLQEAVSTLIRNGAAGPVCVRSRGGVFMDIMHAHQMITGGFCARPAEAEGPLPDLPEERIAGIADRYWEAYDAMDADTDESVLEPYQAEIKELLLPLVKHTADRFSSSGVSRVRLSDIILNEAACPGRGIDGGFQASILSMVCDNEKHDCRTDYPRLAETMADRVAYTLDNGLAFRGTETEKGEAV